MRGLLARLDRWWSTWAGYTAVAAALALGATGHMTAAWVVVGIVGAVSLGYGVALVVLLARVRRRRRELNVAALARLEASRRGEG